MDNFDSLDIADLFNTTTAVNSLTHSESERASLEKKGAFERFCKKMQDSTMLAASIGTFKTFAVLVSSDVKRFFRANDGETVEQFAARLRGEAISMNARWSYVAMLAPYAVGNVPPDVRSEDMSSILGAVEDGILSMGICFFAERGADEKRIKRSGVIELDKTGSPISMMSGDVPADGNPFTSIMDK